MATSPGGHPLKNPVQGHCRAILKNMKKSILRPFVRCAETEVRGPDDRFPGYCAQHGRLPWCVADFEALWLLLGEDWEARQDAISYDDIPRHYWPPKVLVEYQTDQEAAIMEIIAAREALKKGPYQKHTSATLGKTWSDAQARAVRDNESKRRHNARINMEALARDVNRILDEREAADRRRNEAGQFIPTPFLSKKPAALGPQKVLETSPIPKK